MPHNIKRNPSLCKSSSYAYGFCHICQREAILSKELARVKIPTREFTFSSKIWLPQNWIVHRQDQFGSSEIIPTILKDTQAPQEGRSTAAQVFDKSY